jgi:hypothetical protein
MVFTRERFDRAGRHETTAPNEDEVEMMIRPATSNGVDLACEMMRKGLA